MDHMLIYLLTEFGTRTMNEKGKQIRKEESICTVLI